MGVLSLAFRTKKEVRTFFLYLLFFQMPLAQNNFYAKVAYLGMAYTGTLQKLSVFPGGSDGKQFACNAETQVQSLGGKDLLEKGMA